MTLKIGTNTTIISYYTTEQPYLNLVKQSSNLAGSCTDTTRHNNWTYGVGANMNLDANGWPTNFTGIGDAAGKTYSEIDFALTNQSRTGNYVFLYSGGDSTTKFVFPNTSDLTYVDGGSAAMAGAHVSNGRIICNVASNSFQTMRIQVTVLGATPPTNWALIYSPDSTISVVGTRETAYNNGQIFNPDYITKVSPFSVLRMMDWMDVIANFSQVNWTDRPTANWWAWNDGNRFGTSQPPVEVLIAFFNYMYAQGYHITPWFNMPVLANSTYVTNYATILRDGNASAQAGLQAALNSDLGCYLEYGNENWNTGLWGLSGTSQVAQDIGYTNYPATKSITAAFTGSISGTTLTVSAMTSGTIIPNTTNNPLFGAGVTGFPLITAQNSGTTGGTGTYTISTSQGTIASEAMSQGSDFSAMFQNGIRGAVVNGNLFKSVLGKNRVKTVLGGQIGFTARNQTIMTALASDRGGNASDWTGTAASNADVFATAPYFNYGGPNQIPEAFTANADGGIGALLQEAQSGGILPTGFTTVTATDLSGGALLAGWTACKVTSGQSFTTTPANTSIFTVSFGAASGTNPTIQVDGGNTYPIQDYTGAASTVSAARYPLCFTSATSQGAVGTPGWRIEQFGFTDATYGNGMIAAAMCDNSNTWTTYAGEIVSSGLANDLKSCQNPLYGNGIALVCYEGGQQWYPSSNAIYCALFPAANRNTGMKAVYLAYLNAIQNLPISLGYTQEALPLFNNFCLCGAYGGASDNIGNFGACEYIWQSEPIPKYDAVVEMATPNHPNHSWIGKF